MSGGGRPRCAASACRSNADLPFRDCSGVYDRRPFSPDRRPKATCRLRFVEHSSTLQRGSAEFRVLETLRIFSEFHGKGRRLQTARSLGCPLAAETRYWSGARMPAAAIYDRRGSIVEHSSTLQDLIVGRRRHVAATMATPSLRKRALLTNIRYCASLVRVSAAEGPIPPRSEPLPGGSGQPRRWFLCRGFFTAKIPRRAKHRGSYALGRRQNTAELMEASRTVLSGGKREKKNSFFKNEAGNVLKTKDRRGDNRQNEPKTNRRIAGAKKGWYGWQDGSGIRRVDLQH